MKNANCLSDQDLTLHYYGEIPSASPELQHLDNCHLCQQRFTALQRDMAALPTLAGEVDPAAGTRMAARVSEQLSRRQSLRWLPVIGGAAVAAALVITLVIWPAQPEPRLQLQPVQTAANTPSLDTDMPDIDFLNDLELLKELDLLRQIEGV